jgi:uncharacterized protein (TIGR02246 family)
MDSGKRITLAAFLIGGVLLIPTRSDAQKEAPLAARVQRMEDIDAIRNVLISYGRTLDAHDFVGYSRLFAKDGEWVGGFGTVKGPAAIEEFMTKNIGSPGKPGGTYHLLTNFLIDVKGDTGTAWSRWTFITPGADRKPAMAQGGHYEDALVREDGHWKFKRREAFTDIPATGPVQTK